MCYRCNFDLLCRQRATPTPAATARPMIMAKGRKAATVGEGEIRLGAGDIRLGLLEISMVSV
jgi:hypothetical protein